MNTWISFCLYIAGGAFIYAQKMENRESQNKANFHSPNIENLQFLVDAMKAMGRNHFITTHFIAQIEIDIEGSGILRNEDSSPDSNSSSSVPVMGKIPNRNETPITIEEITGLRRPNPTFPETDRELFSYPGLTANGHNPKEISCLSSTLPNRFRSSNVLSDGVGSPTNDSVKQPMAFADMVPSLISTHKIDQNTANEPVPRTTGYSMSSYTANNQIPTGESSFHIDSFLAEGTPINASNTTPFAYRLQDQYEPPDFDLFPSTVNLDFPSGAESNSSLWNFSEQ
jgi:hypothetical protein